MSPFLIYFKTDTIQHSNVKTSLNNSVHNYFYSSYTDNPHMSQGLTNRATTRAAAASPNQIDQTHSRLLKLFLRLADKVHSGDYGQGCGAVKACQGLLMNIFT